MDWNLLASSHSTDIENHPNLLPPYTYIGSSRLYHHWPLENNHYPQYLKGRNLRDNELNVACRIMFWR